MLSTLVFAIPQTALAGDSAAGDVRLAHAMESLSRGTLTSAREAVDALAEAARAHPTQPLYGNLRGEIEILFRAEHAISQSLDATEEAKSTADQKRRSMKLALEPSKLTGKNDPVSAERYRLQAEELLADAKEGEARAKRNFLLAMKRADDLAVDMLGGGEEAIALGLGSALWVVAERNATYLTAEDGTVFSPTVSQSELGELKIRVKIRQAWARQGIEKESSGDKPGALEALSKSRIRGGNSAAFRELAAADAPLLHLGNRPGPGSCPSSSSVPTGFGHQENRPPPDPLAHRRLRQRLPPRSQPRILKRHQKGAHPPGFQHAHLQSRSRIP